jgi:Ion channel
MSLTHISVLLIGFGFMAINLIIHAFFMFLILKSQSYYMRNYPHLKGIASIMGPLLAATFLIIISCSIQVILWSLLVFDFGKFDNFNDALYFSGTTYTTIGAGKQFLVPPYRTGLLVTGLNTAILFAVLSNIARKNPDFEGFF